jgi:hypothetical protein
MDRVCDVACTWPQVWGPARVAALQRLLKSQKEAVSLAGKVGCAGMQHGDAKYMEVCAAIKQQDINTLHFKLQKAIAELGAANATLTRAAGRQRGTRDDAKRARRKRSRTTAQLTSLVDDLDAAHKATGLIAQTYDIMQLGGTFRAWLARSPQDQMREPVQLPWLSGVHAAAGTSQQPAAAPVYSSPMQTAEQRYLRCMEEVSILEREVRDMVAFYEALIASTTNQLAAINISYTVGADLDSRLWLECEPPATEAVRKLQERYLHLGHQALLRRRMSWLQARKQDALNADGKMRSLYAAANLAQDEQQQAEQQPLPTEGQPSAVSGGEGQPQAAAVSQQVHAPVAPQAPLLPSMPVLALGTSTDTDSTESHDSFGDPVLHALIDSDDSASDGEL